jgi:uncharacterized Zn-binding protein involved in type VI secretion
MVTGTVPHIGGTILTGALSLQLNNKPVARMGDKCICTGCGMICTIIQGDANVIVEGQPIAYVGCMPSHGGVITSGQANAFISGSKPLNIVTMPINDIAFPNNSIKNKVLATLAGHGNRLNDAIAMQNTIREAAQHNEGTPKVYNYQWQKEQRIVRDSKVLKVVTLTADVINIPDGETATIKVLNPISTGSEPAQVIALSGTVNNKKITVEWELEVPTTTTNTKS